MSSSLTSENSANFINGISGMGALWASFTSTELDSFIDALSKVFEEGSIQHLASSLYGLAVMECQFEKLPENFIVKICNGIIRVCNSSQLDPQALANIMYAVGLLSFDISPTKTFILCELNKAHLALLQSLANLGMSKFNDIEREQLLMYANTLMITTPLLEQNVATMPIFRVMSSENSVENSISELQESVVSSLSAALRARNADVYITDEYSAFDGALPVDVTVFDDDDPKHPIAFLEVDGPHHFRNGSLRRKDKLKEFLYRKKHPLASFTRVRYDQVQVLGSGHIAFALANFITLTSSHSDAEKRLLRDDDDHAFSARNAERELQKSLSIACKNSEVNLRSICSIFGDVTWCNYDIFTSGALSSSRMSAACETDHN